MTLKRSRKFRHNDVGHHPVHANDAVQRWELEHCGSGASRWRAWQVRALSQSTRHAWAAKHVRQVQHFHSSGIGPRDYASRRTLNISRQAEAAELTLALEQATLWHACSSANVNKPGLNFIAPAGTVYVFMLATHPAD